jgi:hypothetical protein
VELGSDFSEMQVLSHAEMAFYCLKTLISLQVGDVHQSV